MSPIEEIIAKTVGQRADRIVETLCDIVRFPSIVKSDPREAGPGERDCQLYLQKRLEALGFAADLWEPDGPALYTKYEGRPGANKGRTFEGRPNLAGVLKGAGDGRSIMLTGHIDVVPPGAPEHWISDPFAPVVSEGFVRGRGTVDMKGGVACMLMAIEILKEIGATLAGDVVFTIVVDEEIGGMGSLAMVDRGYRADAGIMTEPTANRIAPLCHGILWGRIIVDGIGGHAELTRTMGRQRPGGRHSALPAGHRRHRHPQPPLADRPGEESHADGSSEPDHRDADQGWRASVFDGGPRRDRHRRAVSSAREGRIRPRGPREARGRGASGGGVPGGPVSSQASGSNRLDSRRGLCGSLSRSSFRRGFQSAVSEAGLDPGSPVSALTATSVCRLGSDARRRSISAPVIRLNPINRTSASPSAILWIARRRSHSRFTGGAGGFHDCRGPARRNAYGVWPSRVGCHEQLFRYFSSSPGVIRLEVGTQAVALIPNEH